MNEDVLRTMIREAIAKRLASPKLSESGPKPGDGGLGPDDGGLAWPKLGEGGSQRLALASHASHFRYALPGSGEACLIEPTVQCNHCGYCQSHGH